MKKFLLAVLICLFSFSSVFLVGCGEKKYSAEDVNELYVKVLEEYGDSGGNLDMSVSTSITADTSILNLIYMPYFKCSSSLFFDVGKRQSKTILYAIESFNQKDLTAIYNKLLNVQSAFGEYSKNRLIFEKSNGELADSSLLSSANILIKSLYSLNDVFIPPYFAKFGEDKFDNVEKLNNTILRDELLRDILELSKVPFNYEFMNFLPNKTNLTALDWFDKTMYVKEFVTFVNPLLSKLIAKNDITDGISNMAKEAILSYLQNLKAERDNFKLYYKTFNNAVSGLNLSAYFFAENKNAYKQNCSANERSCFNLVDNFLQGKYNPYLETVKRISNLLV